MKRDAFLSIFLCATFPLTHFFHGQQSVNSGPGVNIASLPFNAGSEVKDTVYIAGHLGVDLTAAVKAPPADPEDESRMVLRSIEKTLQEANMTMDDLVDVTIYCTDLRLYSAFNRVYASSFHKSYPARSFIGVDRLLFGAHFEVTGIAVRNAARKKKPLTTQ
jgi:2-iminobutanoate/2-iminopropanoate deaminase